MGPMRGGFFFFPFFRSRKTGNSAGSDEDDYAVPVRHIKIVYGDGRVETRVEYVNEEAEKYRNSLWGRFMRKLGKLFD